MAEADTQYDALVPADDTAGQARMAGIEVEFSGLDESRVGEILSRTLGGSVTQVGPHELALKDSGIGDVKIVLDTAFRDKADNPLAEWGLQASRVVVPVEIVTQPILPADLPKIDAVFASLRDAGAQGTTDGIFLGFGTHLNPALAGETVAHILPTLRVFALLEDWLRTVEPVDASRRMLPFVDPYPRQLVDALASDAAADWTLDQMIATYLDLAPSRNHALDMLPILRHLDEDAVKTALGSAAASVSGRPAYHYRLPDSRIDEPGWTLAPTWNRWCLIEAAASDPEFVAQLAGAFRAHRDSMTTMRNDWTRQSGEMVETWKRRREAGTA